MWQQTNHMLITSSSSVKSNHADILNRKETMAHLGKKSRSQTWDTAKITKLKMQSCYCVWYSFVFMLNGSLSRLHLVLPRAPELQSPQHKLTLVHFLPTSVSLSQSWTLPPATPGGFTASAGLFPGERSSLLTLLLRWPACRLDVVVFFWFFFFCFNWA